MNSILEQEQIKIVLIVTDYSINKLGIMKGLLSCLERLGISYVVFDQTIANPMINNIEEGVKAFNLAGYEAIIAFDVAHLWIAKKPLVPVLLNLKNPFLR